MILKLRMRRIPFREVYKPKMISYKRTIGLLVGILTLSLLLTKNKEDLGGWNLKVILSSTSFFNFILFIWKLSMGYTHGIIGGVGTNQFIFDLTTS
jgi:hypothetical protein